MHLSQVLLNWYKSNKRDLPWRRTKDPYTVWLSEIILQQTRVDQGLPYYLKFTETFPKVEDLANASEDDVLKLWQGLGYYSRARNLHKTAKQVAFELGGKFPKTYIELIKLKGIGDYTASAITSICYEKPHAVVDGNVYRFLARYFGVDLAINSTEGIKYFKKLAQELLPEKNIGAYNQAVMEFGARHCKPNQPLCDSCPFQDSCVALKESKVNTLPIKKKKAPIKKRYFNYLVLITDDEKTIIEKRDAGIWRNLYQFPLVETNKPILKEDLLSNIKFQAIIDSYYEVENINKEDIVHKLSHQHIYTKFWMVSVHKNQKATFDIKSLNNYAFPVLISRFLDSVELNDSSS